MIRIVTAYDNGTEEEFARLRRKKWHSWHFVVAGEWSESPSHEGKEKFGVRATADGRFWSLLSISFPTRIVAVAEVDHGISIEEAAGELMAAVYVKGGPYVDGIRDYGVIDPAALWKHFGAACDRIRGRKQGPGG